MSKSKLLEYKHKSLAWTRGYFIPFQVTWPALNVRSDQPRTEWNLFPHTRCCISINAA